MAFAIRDRTESTLSEINVTPLVDVVLVLLIIFMVTAPMLSSSVNVDLQTATAAPPPDAREHLIVSVTDDGRIWVGDTPTDVSLLAERVRGALHRTGLGDVAIRGDKRVAYGHILEVLDQLRAAEIKNVGLVMAPPEPPVSGSKR